MPIHVSASYRASPEMPQTALNYLQSQTDNFGLFFSLDRIYYHMASCQIYINQRYPELRALAQSDSLKITKRQDVINVMRTVLRIPDYKLLNKEGKLSTSQDVIENLINDQELSGEARRFATLYREMSARNTILGNLGQYSVLPVCMDRDFQNERMVVAHPRWSLLSTSRFSAAEPSLQNLAREVVDIYTAPKGYQMVFSDSGQIEPRITYSAYIDDELLKNLIILYDDAYYGMLHYILMTQQEEDTGRANFSTVQKKEITQDMKDMRQRLKVLGLAGNYGSANLAAIDAELGPVYERKIVAHPMRRRWEKQVSDQVRAGAKCFFAYFGTPVYPDNAKKDMSGISDYAAQNHYIRCGINNPIQATAAELMHLSIMEAKRTLNSREWVGAWKHDEGMFYVPEDTVDERGPILRELLSYDVDGWIPIRSDLHIGRKKSGFAPPVF